VVNVGAGAGSYEPADRAVIAVEPSVTMIAQRALASGTWDRRFGHLRALDTIDLGYRLVVAAGDSRPDLAQQNSLR
jgi:hypothetical protein